MALDNRFQLRCQKCRWSRMTTGVADDLKDLKEIKANCPTCGGPRKFRCPKCGLPAKMNRIKGNAE